MDVKTIAKGTDLRQEQPEHMETSPHVPGLKPGQYPLSIRDNGFGFDSGASDARNGLGIVSMKERVRLVHGEFSIQSQPGEGTTISVLVPLPEEGK